MPPSCGRRAVHAARAPCRARGAVVSGRASNPGTLRPAPAPDPACADHALSCLCAAACQFRRTDLGRAAYGRARTHRGLSHAAARRAPACRGRPRGRAIRGKLPRRRRQARGRGGCFRGLWWRCWLTVARKYATGKCKKLRVFSHRVNLASSKIAEPGAWVRFRCYRLFAMQNLHVGHRQ